MHGTKPTNPSLSSPSKGPHDRSSVWDFHQSSTIADNGSSWQVFKLFRGFPGSTRSSTVTCQRRQRFPMADLWKVSLFLSPAHRDAFLGHGENSWDPALTARPATLDHDHHTRNKRPFTISRHRAHRSGGPQLPDQEHLMTSLEQETSHLSSFQEKPPPLETSVSWFPFGPTQPPGSQLYSNP